jgi:hypothetical protein
MIESYPNQTETQGDRTALGETGATQPVLPVSIVVEAPAQPGARIVQMNGTFAGGGFYSLNYAWGSAQQLGADAVAGKQLAMPESLTVAPADQKVIGVNFLEDGLPTHWIPDQSFQMAFPLGRYTKPGAPPVFPGGAPTLSQTVEVAAVIPLGDVTLQISAYPAASLGGGGASGGARYSAVVINGRPGSPSITADMVLPDTGESIGTTTVMYESLPENAISGSHLLPVGAEVKAHYAGRGTDTNGNPIAIFRGNGLPIGTFPVLVKKDGGVPGTAVGSVTCSFTYTLYYSDDGGTGNRPIPAATGLTPAIPRFPACAYNTPANFSPGLAYYAGSAIKLYSAAQEIAATQLVTTIVNIQIVDSSQTVQIQTKNLLVLDADTTSDWQTIYTGATC